jgi:hypothetical protein
MSVSARVFISCGQSHRSDELEVARRIAERLSKDGYETYIAVQEQCLKGVKENIFQQLDSSEYFVFVDFKREKLEGQEECRGSLFSHQELAVAAFREKTVVAFRESGVELNGIARFMQANAKPFSDRENLPAIVADEIRQRGWKPDWRAELAMRVNDPAYADATFENRDAANNYTKARGRFFHVAVENRHRDKPAINCYVYLEDIRNAGTGESVPVRTIEFKWCGYTFPNALIAPNASRSFDAFWFPFIKSSRLGFNVFADWGGLHPHVPVPGTYYFTYRVISENFPSVAARFRVVAADRPENTSIELAAN